MQSKLLGKLIGTQRRCVCYAVGGISHREWVNAGTILVHMQTFFGGSCICMHRMQWDLLAAQPNIDRWFDKIESTHSLGNY